MKLIWVGQEKKCYDKPSSQNYMKITKSYPDERFGSLGRLVAWVFLLGPVWAQLPSTLSLATVVMVLAKCASLFVKLKH